MFKLPNSIIRHIYSFDSTFHLIYKNLLDEFNYVNNFWRLKFNNQSARESLSSNDMRATFKQIKNLASYWNNDFSKYKFVSISYMNNILISKCKEICFPTHPTDTKKWNNNWQLLMNNIRDYKFLKAKKILHNI